jgi:hypothetical protein
MSILPHVLDEANLSYQSIGDAEQCIKCCKLNQQENAAFFVPLVQAP